MSNDKVQFADMSVEEEEEEENVVQGTKRQAAEEERQTLAKAETQAVWRVRIVMMFILLSMTIAISVVTYRYSRQVEQDEFTSHYESVSLTLVENFHDSFERRLAALDGLSSAITSHAKSSGSTFPNVTMPDFEVLGATARIQADSAYIIWLPLVTDDTRAGFEAYAVEQQGHVMPAFLNERNLRMQQDAKYGYTDNDPNVGPATRKLHARHDVPHENVHRVWGPVGEGEPEPEGSGPFLPSWQSTPSAPMLSPLMMNFYFFDYLVQSFDELIRTGTAIVSGSVVEFNDVENVQEGSTNEALVNILLSLGKWIL